jgi:tRNA (guanine37-N1)-methyltransferase
MNAPLVFHFITLFPKAIEVWLTTSILGRARESGLFDFSLYQLRDFSKDKHRAVDDVAYGGGGGMVLRIEPLVEAIETLRAQLGDEPSEVIHFSPAGERLSQKVLDKFPARETRRHLILICGHYEGIDQRVLDHWVDREISLGDFVLTGGELPAVAFADALIRQQEGTLGGRGASLNESFRLHGKLLEYPHYTRPSDYRGVKVPEVLLSGDHGAIDEWRREQALERTRSRRPDLLVKGDS